MQPEVEEHGRRQRAQEPQDGPESVPEALGPEDLEGLDLDRVDLLLVAPADPGLEPPERPPEAEEGREEEDGGQDRALGAAQQDLRLAGVG